MDREAFFQTGKAFRSIGAKIYGWHIKSGGEGAWWHSRLGEVHPRARQVNLAKLILEEGHAADCRILVYHRHMEDKAMAEKHPDWVCVDAEGEPLSSKRGKYMCLNSPYCEYVLQRALELVELGADGCYYDERHMPASGCWCGYCRECFTKETGLPHPEGHLPFDPLWNKLKDFNNAAIEGAFVRWRQAIHAKNKDCVLLVSANALPGLEDRTITTRLLRLSDCVKTEFTLGARAGQNRIFSAAPELARPLRDLRMAHGARLGPLPRRGRRQAGPCLDERPGR